MLQPFPFQWILITLRLWHWWIIIILYNVQYLSQGLWTSRIMKLFLRTKLVVKIFPLEIFIQPASKKKNYAHDSLYYRTVTLCLFSIMRPYIYSYHRRCYLMERCEDDRPWWILVPSHSMYTIIRGSNWSKIYYFSHEIKKKMCVIAFQFFIYKPCFNRNARDSNLEH